MAGKSLIEWTDATWNPVRGCFMASPGCTHCFAMREAYWHSGVGGAYEGLTLLARRGPIWTGDVRLVPELLAEPLRWRSPRMVFVNSMSDLFHEDVPDEFIIEVAHVMRRAYWHTFQVLTKRSGRMRDLLNTKLRFAAKLPHIWWGVSVENRRHGMSRVAHLRAARAAVRFLSVEPLLEELGEIGLDGIHWVIVGGESGPRARPMRKDWVLSILRQCRDTGVPFFFKQWGGVRKKETGSELNGRCYDEYPPVMRAEPPTEEDRRALVTVTEIEALKWRSHPLAAATRRRVLP